MNFFSSIFYIFALIKVMNKKYCFSFLTFFVITLGFAGPGGGPPPPSPPPPPGFPLDGNLLYLFIFGFILAFFKLRKRNFAK